MSKRFLPLAAALSLAACGTSPSGGGGPMPPEKDMAINFNQFDFAVPDDGGPPPQMNECGDTDPGCTVKGFGPATGQPFPLSTDMPKDPNEQDDGVGRDKNGWLGLNSSNASFDYMWLANSEDWGRGTVTKMDSKTVREVARYATVTCYSIKGKGNQNNCDGMMGCCAMDSYPEWQARQMKGNAPKQNVQRTSNNPSRTAVDFNGDVWVANRAFGGQSSVTKIQNDIASCPDHNGVAGIQTSSDVNGDGVIDTDCNDDGMPDDIASVKAKACTNGMKQEYYGVDDDCILFTTNTNIANQWGRPLGLGPGAMDFGPSDAWPGTFMDGKFFRIDGTSGLVKDEVKCINQPYGVAIDATSYAWAPPLGGGSVCVFDVKNTKMNLPKAVRSPQFGVMNGYGVSLDTDQNVWFGGFGEGTAYRYTPDRSNGFTKLDQGGWIKFTSPGGNTIGGFATHRGVAVDLRNPMKKEYWAWLASDSSWIIRIPASTYPAQKPMMDQQVDGSAFPAVKVAGSTTIGVGVDRDQNIWGISYSGSVATRIKVDMAGMMTAPDINSPPMGNNKCPAGDRCPYGYKSTPTPYTYSDFTGFGLRNFTRPKGSYSYVQKGCDDGQGNHDTKWVAVAFDADVPLNTSLTVKARSGNTPSPDMTWGQWTPSYNMTPADLINGMPLDPNLMTDGWLQVEFDFATTVANASPKLKSFQIMFECNNVPG